jgi:hypothetical protein
MPRMGAGVVAQLTENRVKHLKITGTLLSHQLDELCLAMSENTSCSKLELDGCGLSSNPDAIHKLLRNVLLGNTSVVELDLQNNGFGACSVFHAWLCVAATADSRPCAIQTSAISG